VLALQRAEATKCRLKVRVEVLKQLHFRLVEIALFCRAHNDDHADESLAAPEKQ